ncbi:MAG: chromosomal replication initiator protein DnaA [Candidatus Gracilibacteria bacterium]|nr:chromosomal replication initiator protein DnaA [Candidatus Gracilibacteria bacterium]
MEKFYRLQNILLNVIEKVKKQDFLVYFRKISILDIKDNELAFGVISTFVKGNLEIKFYNDILEATRKELPNIDKISFEVDKDIDNPTNKYVIDCTKYYKESEKSNKKSNKIDSNIGNMTQVNKIKPTNERYSLQNFVVGSDNQLAFSACEAVSKNPGKSYNPLYIYGDVGLGKTHLLQGTSNEILKKFKDKKVVYTTADKFITEYVMSVKKRSVERMRQKFQEIDVLVVDDVQFLSGKEQTQNELYNIFNLLYETNKQIIISGDRPPKELKELEPRLRSRFEWGITVDIGKPDYETRLAILQEKAREKEFLIPQDVAEFVAANVTENVRALEGVLTQLIAEYDFDGAIPTLEKVAQKLKKLSFTTDLIGNNNKVVVPRKTIRSYEDIIDAVSSFFGIEKEGILGENRKKEFMIPRQVAMYLLKTKLNYTYERIGNIFSGRNHAAVLYSCNKLEQIMKKDKNLLQEINSLRDGIGI